MKIVQFKVQLSTLKPKTFCTSKRCEVFSRALVSDVLISSAEPRK